MIVIFYQILLYFTDNKMLNPSLDFVGTKARIRFNADCLKQEKIAFSHGKIVNIYIFDETKKVLK